MRNLKQLLYFQHGKEIYSLNLKNGGNLRREVETIKTELNRNAAAKSLQSCLTLCDPINGSSPGSPLGFSRQEHWSGLLLPSPMHESEK